jgi:hypothetical protein
MSDLETVTTLVEQIKPLFAGKRPEVQGAALAELLAIWLAGHVVRHDAEATRTLRADLLAEHLLAVRQLVEVNAKILGTSSENR